MLSQADLGDGVMKVKLFFSILFHVVIPEIFFYLML
jgi:hypothetical protein